MSVGDREITIKVFSKPASAQRSWTLYIDGWTAWGGNQPTNQMAIREAMASLRMIMGDDDDEEGDLALRDAKSQLARLKGS